MNRADFSNSQGYWVIFLCLEDLQDVQKNLNHLLELEYHHMNLD